MGWWTGGVMAMAPTAAATYSAQFHCLADHANESDRTVSACADQNATQHPPRSVTQLAAVAQEFQQQGVDALRPVEH